MKEQSWKRSIERYLSGENAERPRAELLARALNVNVADVFEAGLAFNQVVGPQENPFRSLAELKAAGNRAWRIGDLWAAFGWHYQECVQAANEGDEKAVASALIDAASNAAGLKHGAGAIKRLQQQFEPERVMKRMTKEMQAKWHLPLCNAFRNRKKLRWAKRRFECARTLVSSLPTNARKELAAACHRRQVSFEPSVKLANQAVRLAEANRDRYRWGVATALALRGAAEIVEGQYTGAIDSYGAILHDNKQASYWHKAQAHFGVALAHYLGRDSVEQVLGNLLVAEFIVNELGLRGDFIVGLGQACFGSEEVVDPSAAISCIRSMTPRADDETFLKDLGQEWIDSNLRHALGKSATPDT